MAADTHDPAVATVADVLMAARETYELAPAHGLPTYNRATRARTECVISATYRAACELGAPGLTKPALAALARAAACASGDLPEWEEHAETAEACELFLSAAGSA